jgi:heptosyltransferase-2
VTPLGRGERVAVRVPDWLGDLVMAEPALRALDTRVAELGGELTLLGELALLAVLGDALPRARRRDAASPDAWRGHDVAVLLTNSFRSAWQASRAGIPRRAGYARDLRRLLLTDSIVPAREVGAVPVRLGAAGRRPRYLPRPYGATCIELVHALGCVVRDPRPRLVPTARGLDDARERVRALGGEPFVLACVGARAGSAKGYPPELWARALAGAGHRAVLAGGPGEEDAIRRVAAELGGRAVACVEPIAGLAELVALASLAQAVMTADSGPRHVAAATDAPLVVVAGPTDPRHTADHTARTTLLRVPVECGPCHREACPLRGELRNRCMTLVEPERVAEALRALLESPVASSPASRDAPARAVRGSGR